MTGLPPKAVMEFQRLYKEKFSVAITYKEAERLGSDFLTLMAFMLNQSQPTNNKHMNNYDQLYDSFQ